MAIKKISFYFIGLSFIGFLDATYITTRHFLGLPLPCSLLKGCEQVTSSQYANIGGIPVAFLGMFYYLTIFILTVAYFDSKKRGIIKIAAHLTAVGFIASLWFLYLQIFVIRAVCLYCVFSAATSTLLFILGLFFLKSVNSTHEPKI